MSSKTSAAPILMAANIRDSGNGFHSLRFRVEGGRSRMTEVVVLISQDAHRKLLSQAGTAHRHFSDKSTLLKAWANWEISQRTAELGMTPSNITITSSDLDEFGAYTAALVRSLEGRS